MWSPFKSSDKGSRGVPTDRVLSLSSQGMSEQQIIKQLRNEGYSPIDVDSALKESLRDSVHDPMPPMNREPSRDMPPRDMGRQPDYMNMKESPMPPNLDRNVPADLRMPEISRRDDFEIPSSGGRDEFEIPPSRRDDFGLGDPLDAPPPRDLPAFEQEPIPRMGRRRSGRRDLEEMAEGIADEKWSEFESETGDIRNQVKDLTDRIVVLERTMRRLQGQKNTEIEEIQTSIATYKQSITEVGEKMEGMEKALKDSLTPMMETLRSLSDVVKALKDKK